MTSTTTTGRPASPRRRPAVFASSLAVAAVMLLPAAAAHATEIRTHAGNRVPACVTPEKLMVFLAARNDRLDPRFKSIARHYKQHGEQWRVRWDYAFFQMALETNYLAFRRGDGNPGDVRPAQNNFAGLGTTGGGVPGDSYPDVSTGVLAQIQHLVAYSGERLAAPVGPRTRLKQDDIVSVSARLGRPVRFADLARRWAVDPKYGRSIEWVADRFREAHCATRAEVAPPGDDAIADSTPAAVAPPPAIPAPALRSALGGEPRLVRAPALSEPPRAASRPAAASANAAVRTVWTRSKPGDVPLLPQAGPAPAPRRVTAVAAGNAVAPATTITQPVAAAAAPSPPAADARAAAADIASASEPDGPTIALAAAAAPFAAGHVVAETKGPHGSCRIVMASYGGTRTVLIRATSRVAVELVVLSVVPGFEQSMVDNFIRTRAPGGIVDGTYPDRDRALERARAICPDAS